MRVFLFCLSFGLFALIAAPEGRSQTSPIDGVSACREMVDDAARLACYDSLFAEPVPELAQTPVQQAPVQSAPKTDTADAVKAVDPVAEFGAEDLPKPEADESQQVELESIEAIVTAAELSARDRLIITLDNGQVWRQTSSSSKSSTARRAIGKTAVIKKGTMGSKIMRIGKARSIRVERLK